MMPDVMRIKKLKAYISVSISLASEPEEVEALTDCLELIEAEEKRLTVHPDFQQELERLKKKYPLIQTLYNQGKPYETWPKCELKRQVDLELGIIGWKSVPIYGEDKKIEEAKR